MSGPWEKYATAAEAPASPAGPWSKYGAAPAPAAEETSGIAALGAGLGKGFGQVALNVQKLAGKGISAIGGQRAGQWLQDDANSGLTKIEGEAAPYKRDHPILEGAGELGGNLIGTAPVGGLLARGASAIPGVAEVAPGLVNAIRSSGMSTGQVGVSTLADLAARSAGGAITGGASAWLVDPEAAAVGAGFGAALPGVLRVGGVLARGAGGAARGVVEPWTESGRRAIAGRTLARFGVAPADVAGLSSAPTVTGARLSLAEQIARPEGAAGAARLQDALSTLPDLSPRLVAREAENNAARVTRLQELAGNGGGRDFAAAERAGTAGPMYQESFTVKPRIADKSYGAGAITRPDGVAELSTQQEGALRSLMSSPAIKQAQQQARANAENSGAQLGGDGSVQGLHQMKLALDDMITKAENKTTGAAANTAAGLKSAQKRLVSFIESISPEYANARGVYAQMSRPVNQMDVAAEVLRAGSSKTSDLAGTPRLMPNALMSALRDEGRLIQRATGRDLGNSLDQVLDPVQHRTIRSVAEEVNRAAAVARAGNGPGSATAQRLASMNLLQQMGIPEAAATNPLVQTIMRPVQFGAQLAEPRIQQLLLDIVQNPALAEDAMRQATPAQRVHLQRLMAAAGPAAARLAPLTAGDQ